jgi:hypothetical protein
MVDVASEVDVARHMPTVGAGHSGGGWPRRWPRFLLQGDQAGRRGGEPARIEVELPQVAFEVDIEPSAACGARLFRRYAHEVRADASPAGSTGDDRVEDEGMDSAVPRDVDEAQEPDVVACADPAEAMSFDLSTPVVAEESVLECLGVEPVELPVVEAASPLVPDFQREPI